jgi:hypothetical protein
MKHVKLFESFVNEELSPELKKRTYDAMIKIAKDPNAIDNLKRRNQANDIQNSVTPAVKKLINELEGHAKRAIAEKLKVSSDSVVGVELNDFGLQRNAGEGSLRLYVRYKTKDNTGAYSGWSSIMTVLICKDKYEKSSGSRNNTDAMEVILSDRAFVNTLKKLIVQIQNDEIPGEEPVPAKPESLTPQGSLDNVPKEDVISRYGTGGDRGNFSGLPSQDTEAGQIARGR